MLVSIERKLKFNGFLISSNGFEGPGEKAMCGINQINDPGCFMNGARQQV